VRVVVRRIRPASRVTQHDEELVLVQSRGEHALVA
jgi:hypothetical protein